MSNEVLPSPFIPTSGSTTVTAGGVSASATTTSISVDGKDQLIMLNDGSIQLGNPSEPNNIFFNGGIQYQVTELTSASTFYNISNNDFFIVVNNSSYTNINLPAALGEGGKNFIVIRKFAGASILNINPFGSDKIEDDPDPLTLTNLGDRSQFISDGVDNWYTV